MQKMTLMALYDSGISLEISPDGLPFWKRTFQCWMILGYVWYVHLSFTSLTTKKMLHAGEMSTTCQPLESAGNKTHSLSNPKMFIWFSKIQYESRGWMKFPNLQMMSLGQRNMGQSDLVSLANVKPWRACTTGKLLVPAWAFVFFVPARAHHTFPGSPGTPGLPTFLFELNWWELDEIPWNHHVFPTKMSHVFQLQRHTLAGGFLAGTRVRLHHALETQRGLIPAGCCGAAGWHYNCRGGVEFSMEFHEPSAGNIHSWEIDDITDSTITMIDLPTGYPLGITACWKNWSIEMGWKKMIFLS